MITLRISLHSNPRGPGFWKLNTSLLTETDYVNQIKRTIQETQEEYKDDDSVNPSLLWEVIKMKVREKSLRYSAKRSNQRKQRETEIEQAIARLEEQIDKTTDTQSSPLEEQLYEQKNKLEKMIEFRTKGAILRSKARWYNEGEKNTKYFLNMEKRHYKQGTISQIKIDDDNFVTSDKDILTECTSFYKSLYASKGDTTNRQAATCFFETENDTVLQEHEQKSCDGFLTKKECLEAIKSMESEKTLVLTVYRRNFIRCFGQIYQPPLLMP